MATRLTKAVWRMTATRSGPREQDRELLVGLLPMELGEAGAKGERIAIRERGRRHTEEISVLEVLRAAVLARIEREKAARRARRRGGKVQVSRGLLSAFGGRGAGS